jgi:CzcA family heavy metal efflux pump
MAAGLVSRHARAIALATVALVGAGVLAALNLPSSIYPPLEFPRIVVVAHSGTLPAQTMTLTVTRPIEQAVMEVPGIRRVRSRSIRGAAEISAQFDPATDMIVALQQVQGRVAEIRGDLPADADLTVERMTPAVFPVFILSLTGSLPTADLNDYAMYVMRPALARVPGAGRIETLASDTREIEVVLDPAKLQGAGLTVGAVAESLDLQNRLQPVGRYAEAGQQQLSLASGLWPSADAIASAPVAGASASTLRVGDLGTVFPGSPDRTMLITGNGKDAVSISISQQIGANILTLKRGLDTALGELARALPAGLTVTKVYDLAEFVSDAIANVRDAILIGGLLAVFVLILFLRNVRLTLVAALALPLAVIPTFAFMQVFGGSINLMSMGGLAVAIGLVIDDAVVVVERIHRRAGDGAAGVDLAIAELLAPLVSSTLTTVVVFAPLGLLSGVVGQFFRALSLSLSVAVLLSLVVSITVVPLLARRLFRSAPPPAEDAPAGDAHGVGRAYRRILHVMVTRPIVAGLVAIALACATVVLFLSVGTGFLPPADEGGFVIDYLTPEGSSLAETDRQVRAIEGILQATPEVAAYSRRTGSELGLFATAQNTGDILVRLKPRAARDASAEDIIAALRPKIQEAAPLAEIEFVQLLQDMLGDLEGSPTPIEVKIFGDDTDELEALSGPVETLLEQVPGVVDVVGMQRGSPEVTWTIDPVASGRIGLSVADVSTQLADAWSGRIATDLRLLDRRVPVRVRLPDAVRFDPARLPRTLIRGTNGQLVPISSLAAMTRANGQSEQLRENLRGMALVSARLEGRDLGSAVAEIRSRLQAMTLPVGYTYEIGGQYESQRQAFRELLIVFVLGALLVLMILVVQFRAFVPAILILLAAPLSLGGALLLLRLTGTDLNVSSAMGLVLLIGLVVKNGIMLLDVTERLRAQGVPVMTAIEEAARIRVRPILMTTFCTLVGLLPLALGFGAGADLQKPLALAVIGGLALSTPVTLIAIPGLYGVFRAHRGAPADPT